MDVLADVLQVSRVRGALLATVKAHEPWGLELRDTPGAAFHAVTSGTCWLRAGEHRLRLMPGDVILLPTGSHHVLASDPHGPTRAFDRVSKERALNDQGELVLPGPGSATGFLCAAYDYDHEVAHPLLSLLPGVLHLPADQPGDSSPVQATLRLIRGELGPNNPGSAAVLDRLIDVLFVQVLRAWLESEEPSEGASWLRALHDPEIASAIALLHEQPERSWTIEALAGEVNLSRATLARRFTESVGEPPLSYLTRWRMDLAARRLRDTREPVGAIAGRVGYSSEYAFSRAFRRARGEPPGRYRRLTATNSDLG